MEVLPLIGNGLCWSYRIAWDMHDILTWPPKFLLCLSLTINIDCIGTINGVWMIWSNTFFNLLRPPRATSTNIEWYQLWVYLYITTFLRWIKDTTERTSMWPWLLVCTHLRMVRVFDEFAVRSLKEPAVIILHNECCVSRHYAHDMHRPWNISVLNRHRRHLYSLFRVLEAFLVCVYLQPMVGSEGYTLGVVRHTGSVAGGLATWTFCRLIWRRVIAGLMSLSPLEVMPN